VNAVVSVNVGLPRDVQWQGKVVHTGVWKKSVTGRLMARRLNLDGDGQGDLGGHGGEITSLELPVVGPAHLNAGDLG